MEKKRILCFGDSNTWGYNAEDGSRFSEDVRWTGRLAKLLGPEYTVIEEGQNGRTTVWDDPVENRLAGLTYLWPCMESHYPFDLIIIMLGTNDLKRYFGLTAKNIADGAGRLVHLAQMSAFGRDGRPPKVLLTAPIRMRYWEGFGYMFDPAAEKNSQGFAAEFAAIAENMGCEFIAAALYAGPGPVDGLHLDEAGHAALAEAFCRKIREIL